MSRAGSGVGRAASNAGSTVPRLEFLSGGETPPTAREYLALSQKLPRGSPFDAISTHRFIGHSSKNVSQKPNQNVKHIKTLKARKTRDTPLLVALSILRCASDSFSSHTL